jgi:PPE-repeat protein
MDFLLLPPEVNSARIYSGPGSGSLVAAANSWNGLAAELEQAAAGSRAVVLNLLDSWQGPSSSEMLSAAMPLIAWMQTTAANARQTAQAAQSAAAAYNAARYASVHPTLVTANRTQLSTLVSTNLFGQNSPAIAANEAEYSQMWVQDIVAMMGYQTSSSTVLQPFTAAPPVTTEVTPAATAAVTPAATTSLLGFIQTIIPGFTLGDPLGNIAAFITSPIGLAFLSSGAYLDAPIALLVGLLGFSMLTEATQQNAQAFSRIGDVLGSRAIANVVIPSQTPTPVQASTGTGERIGRLCVPPSWAQEPRKPEQGSVSPIPEHEAHSVPVGLPVIPFVPVTGGRAKKHPRGTDPDQYPIGLPVKITPPRNPSGG